MFRPVQTLQAFFAALVQSNTASFDTLLGALLASAKPQTPAAGPSSGISAPLGSPSGAGPAGKQAYHSVAQCVAVLCLAAGDAKLKSTVETLIKNLRTAAKGAEPVQLLSLLSLGEIGRRRDLSKHADVEGIVTSAFGCVPVSLLRLISFFSQFSPAVLVHIFT
jgi:cullin-associated NEDD8-dissociated protein 1